MEFSTEAVLSTIYGRLLTKIDDVYEVLNYLVDDNLFTHQLPRASRFVKPFVLNQHPELEEWEKYNEHINTDNWEEFKEKAIELFGETININPVNKGVWTYKNPIKEAEEMVGKDNVIVSTGRPPEK